MALEIFSFPFHNFQHVPNDPAPHVTFNGGWTFSAKPTAPTIRTFTLTFSGMAFYLNAGGVVDATINPDKNALTFDQFYNRHGTWDTFQYNHPVYGTLNVRFAKPFEMPKIRGNGVLEDFTIQLVEMLQ